MKKLLKFVFFCYFDWDVKMYFIILFDVDYMYQVIVQLLFMLVVFFLRLGFFFIC